MKSMPDETVA